MKIYRISLKMIIIMAALGILSSSFHQVNRIVYVAKTKPLVYRSTKSNKSLNYRLFVPDMCDTQKYPLVLTLHGGAQRGNDNQSQLEDIALAFISKKNQTRFPCFVLSPQCPNNTQWLNVKHRTMPFDHYNQSEVPESEEMKMIIEVISDLSRTQNIDTSRIYVIGFSMGSSGTWDIITRHPEVFAAAVPISGVSDLRTAEKIKNVRVWAFHGLNDNISPVRLNMEMQKAINDAGGSCKLTIFKNQGHGCFNSALKYPGFMEWLFLQKKS